MRKADVSDDYNYGNYYDRIGIYNPKWGLNLQNYWYEKQLNIIETVNWGRDEMLSAVNSIYHQHSFPR